MKKVFLALILALLPISVSANLTFIDDTSPFTFDPISFNSPEPKVGNDVRVTVTVYNTSEDEQQGIINVFAGMGGEQIGKNLLVVAPPRGVDSVTMTWHPVVEGYYNINATLEATIGSVSVNKFNTMVYVEGNGKLVFNSSNSDNSNNTDSDSNSNSNSNSENNTTNGTSSNNSQSSGSSTSVPNSTVAPTTGALVEFSAKTGETSDGDVVVWNFSDNQSYTGNTVKRTFERSGDYSVTRLIISPNGQTVSEVTNFRIAESEGLLFGSYLWFWLFLLLLLILAGIIIYTHKQVRKIRKSRRN